MNHDKKRNKYLIISGVIMAGTGIYYAIFSAIMLGIMLIGLNGCKKAVQSAIQKVSLVVLFFRVDTNFFSYSDN